ncbi:MAG: hypothetical protein ACJ764_14350 [Solirubrobacteraceae bacterium]
MSRLAGLLAGVAVGGLAIAPGGAIAHHTSWSRVAGAATVSTSSVNYLAGYSLGRSAKSLKVTTTFVLPRIACGSRARAFAPSVGVYSSSNVPTAAAVFAGCNAGHARYWPVLVMNGGYRKYNTGASDLHPGDRVALQARETQYDAYVSLTDKTLGVTQSWLGLGRDKLTSAWVGDSTWGNSRGFQSIPDFGSLNFTHTRMNGVPLGSVRGLTRYDMRSNRGTLQIRARRTTSSGTAFRTIFKHA